MVRLPLPRLGAPASDGAMLQGVLAPRLPVVQPSDMGASVERWPGAAEALREELAGRPGRLALLCGPGGERTAMLIGGALGAALVHVGRVLTSREAPPDPAAVGDALADATILVDCEILFDPQMGLDPLQLFRILARRAPRIVLWPGRIASGRATYSEPGRRDYYDRELTDALVLHPRPTTFPDEVPYAIERIP